MFEMEIEMWEYSLMWAYNACREKKMQEGYSLE